MSRLEKYVKATAAEMKHVSWPTRQQALVYTALVIAISAVVSLYLSGFDYIFTQVLHRFIY